MIGVLPMAIHHLTIGKLCHVVLFALDMSHRLNGEEQTTAVLLC